MSMKKGLSTKIEYTSHSTLLYDDYYWNREIGGNQNVHEENDRQPVLSKRYTKDRHIKIRPNN